MAVCRSLHFTRPSRALKPYARDAAAPPLFKTDMNLGETDQLEELLKYLTHNTKDCLLYGAEPLNQPAPDVEEYGEGVLSAQKKLLEQASSDETAIRTMQENKPPFVPFEAVCVLTSFRREHWMLTAPQPSVPTSHYHLCRLALTHLGYCRFDKTSAFCILENSARFHRSLAQLDKTSGYTPRRRLCLADFSLQT